MTTKRRSSLWAFVVRYLWPELVARRGRVAVALMLLFLSTGLYILAAESIRAVLAALRSSITGGALPSGLLGWLAHVTGARGRPLFEFAMVVAISVPVVAWTSAYFRDWAFEKLAVDVATALRQRLHDHVLRVKYIELAPLSPAVLVKRIVADSREVRQVVIEAGLRRAADAAHALGLVVYLAFLEPVLACVSVAAVIVYLVAATLSARSARDRVRVADEGLEDLTRLADETLSRIPDIRANGQEEREASRFGDASGRYADAAMRATAWLLVDRSLTGALSALAPVAVLFVGGVLVYRDALQLETLVTFAAMTERLNIPVNNLSAVPLTLKRAGVTIANLDDLLAVPVESPSTRSGRTGAERRGSGITLAGVRFAYAAGGRSLEIADVRIAPGERIAIVGPSGSGKTTLLHLLFGFFDDYQGRIVMDDAVLGETTLADWRDRVSLVLQENYVFEGTVRENIAYGRREVSGTERTVEQATDDAGLGPDIARMEKGLDTSVARLGRDLSGGQRRRVALARALTKDPAVLLLDEPLAGVAPGDRQAILERVFARTGRTVLVTTHDADACERADRVLFLEVAPDDGTSRVAAFAPHPELLATSARYARHFAAVPTEVSDARDTS